MENYFTKMLLVLTPILLLLLISSSSCGAERILRCQFSGGECKFLPFSGPLFNSNEHGEGRRSVCNMFHGSTCFSASLFNSVSFSLQNLATYGEAIKECLYVFELLQCSSCHSQVRPLRICASFCDRVLDACSEAYFGSDVNQVLVPCGASEGFICGKASKWEFNGTSFCHALGFTQEADESETCFGIKFIRNMNRINTKRR